MIASFSVRALLDAYRSGALSPVEVLQATLAQAAAREGQLHALCAIDAEGALTAARASEARWRAGTALALDGVPVTLKENIAVPGAAYRLGTAATPDDVYEKLVAACETAVKSDDYRATVSKLESNPDYHTGAEFRAMLESESATNAEIIKEAGLAK